MIARLREADHAILILNLLLLMTIGVLPFATDLMAQYLRDPQGQSIAAAVVVPYAAATPLAFVSPYITLGMRAAIAAFYALPVAAGAG